VVIGSVPTVDDAPLVGGTAKAPYRILKYLLRRSDITVAGYYFNGPQNAGPNLHRIGRLSAKLYFTTLLNELAILLNWRKISSADVIQLHHPHYALVAGILNRLTGGRCKVIVKAHGTAIPELYSLKTVGLRGFILKFNGLLHLWHDRLALSFADIVLTSSDYQHNEMQRLYRVPKEKLRTVYNGYDPEYFRFSATSFKKNKTILFVGRAVPKKNLGYVIELYSRVKALDPEFNLVIVTSEAKEHPQTFRWLQKKLSYVEDGQIVVRPDETKLAAIFAGASHFICPSVEYESIPSVIYEALASGCTVLSTLKWGIPEILPPHEGLAHELESDVNRIIAKNDQPNHFSRISRFSYAALVESYVDLYKEQ
jgi:glycosyltransferase involved in cell wall biosynthesis